MPSASVLAPEASRKYGTISDGGRQRASSSAARVCVVDGPDAASADVVVPARSSVRSVVQPALLFAPRLPPNACIVIGEPRPLAGEKIPIAFGYPKSSRPLANDIGLSTKM